MVKSATCKPASVHLLVRGLSPVKVSQEHTGLWLQEEPRSSKNVLLTQAGSFRLDLALALFVGAEPRPEPDDLPVVVWGAAPSSPDIGIIVSA